MQLTLPGSATDVDASTAVLGSGLVDLAYLAFRAGSRDGGRALFERLISQLVGVRYPQMHVRQIRADPGDWGLDTILGELDLVVSVWQSKYFLDGVGDSQRKQIRDSLTSVMEAAKREDFSVDVWTLCVPCCLNPEETKWWDGFKRRKQRELGIRIELWEATRLERILLSPDAERVYRAYFASGAPTTEPRERPVQDLPHEDLYDEALFVVQLRAARITMLRSAKREFFNAEILAREVTDKGVGSETEALSGIRATYYALWEHRFNAAQTTRTEEHLPGFHSSVMQAIEQYFHANKPSPLQAGLVHNFGFMHQLVEEGRAGWARNYRAIAEKHGH